MSSSAPGTTMVALVDDGGEKHMGTVFDDWINVRVLLDLGG
ncbi:hypothetical protein AB0395_18495 [Streptosporangium sp. NPDC051023]